MNSCRRQVSKQQRFSLSVKFSSSLFVSERFLHRCFLRFALTAYPPPLSCWSTCLTLVNDISEISEISLLATLCCNLAAGFTAAAAQRPATG